MNDLQSKIVFDVPDLFKSFIETIGEDHLDNVMFMGAYNQNNELIFLYKNKISRNYVNINDKGNFFIWNNSNKTYDLINREEALKNYTGKVLQNY